jgi:cytoskeletal protein CcmA (bactofilin family)
MAMTIGKAMAIAGSVHASESITVSGTVVGDVVALDEHVTVEAGGKVDGAVMAREITVRGASIGRLVATEIVRVQPSGRVTADIATPKLVIYEGAVINGRVGPARVEAAARVAAYRERLTG